MPPPRFYVAQLSEEERAALRLSRERKSVENVSADSSHLRLIVREEVHELKAETLKRRYEHEA